MPLNNNNSTKISATINMVNSLYSSTANAGKNAANVGKAKVNYQKSEMKPSDIELLKLINKRNFKEIQELNSELKSKKDEHLSLTKRIQAVEQQLKQGVPTKQMVAPIRRLVSPLNRNTPASPLQPQHNSHNLKPVIKPSSPIQKQAQKPVSPNNKAAPVSKPNSAAKPAPVQQKQGQKPSSPVQKQAQKTASPNNKAAPISKPNSAAKPAPVQQKQGQKSSSPVQKKSASSPVSGPNIWEEFFEAKSPSFKSPTLASYQKAPNVFNGAPKQVPKPASPNNKAVLVSKHNSAAKPAPVQQKAVQKPASPLQKPAQKPASPNNKAAQQKPAQKQPSPVQQKVSPTQKRPTSASNSHPNYENFAAPGIFELPANYIKTLKPPSPVQKSPVQKQAQKPASPNNKAAPVSKPNSAAKPAPVQQKAVQKPAFPDQKQAQKPASPNNKAAPISKPNSAAKPAPVQQKQGQKPASPVQKQVQKPSSPDQKQAQKPASPNNKAAPISKPDSAAKPAQKAVQKPASPLPKQAQKQTSKPATPAVKSTAAAPKSASKASAKSPTSQPNKNQPKSKRI